MPSAVFTPSRVAHGQVTAQVGPVFTAQRGFASVTRSSAGVYVLTLTEGCQALNMVPTVTRHSTLAGHSAINILTPTTVEVRTFDVAVPPVGADVNFSITIDRITG
jgi:hypothetical protein